MRQAVVTHHHDEQPHIARHAGGSTAFAGDRQRHPDARGVLDDLAAPQVGRHQRLVPAGEIGGRRDGRVARFARSQDLGPREIPRPPGVDVVVGAAVGAHERGHIVLAFDRWADLDGVEAQRPTQRGPQVLADRHAGEPLAQLGDHPGRRRQMELEFGARFIGQPPLGEGREAFLAVEHRRVSQRREREPAHVRDDLFDGDGILSVRAEFRNVGGDGPRRVEQPVGDELPQHTGDDGPAGRLQDVTGRRRGGAERLRDVLLAVDMYGNLRRRQCAVVDLEPAPVDQDVEPALVGFDVLSLCHHAPPSIGRPTPPTPRAVRSCGPCPPGCGESRRDGTADLLRPLVFRQPCR